MRLFQEGILAEGSPYGKHPGDYTLFEIGTFDQESGDVEKATPKIDHGTATMHKSRALLELDFHENIEPGIIARREAMRPKDDGRTTPNSRKNKDMIYGPAKETTPS